MKSPLILLIVLGTVLVVIAIALSLSPSANPGAIQKLLPRAMEGFALVERIERGEPVFTEQGELYSSHAFFAPLSASEYEKHIDRLGVAIYLFKDESGAKKVEELLLSGIQPELIQVSNRTVALIGGVEQLRLLWQKKRLLYEILVTAARGGEKPELLKRAALAAAQASIESEGAK